MLKKKMMRPKIYLFALWTIFGWFGLVNAGSIPPLDDTKACGTNQPLSVLQNIGFLTTPKFDNFHYYEPNSRCSWTLQAPDGQIIILRKMVFSLNLDCDSDALEIYEGVPPEGTMVDRFCGYWVPTVYKSKSNVLHLKFYSGRSPRNAGFQFYFDHSLPSVECKKNQTSCRHNKKCVESHQMCDGVDDCEDGTDEENCGSTPLVPDCGTSVIPPVSGNDRIVGGQPSAPGSWPWQMSLKLLDRPPPLGHWCGAVLINQQWALTAAHCFKQYMDLNLWNVLLGKHYKLLPEIREQLRYIESVHIHPDYKGMVSKPSDPWLKKKQHDIALIRLNAPVILTDYISPICLPEQDEIPPPGSMCYVIGWGETYGTGFEGELKQAAVPIISLERCRLLHRFFSIADTMVCAGYSKGGHDSCQGDSGGPLMFARSNETWELQGIVSTGGSICADAEQPGIYTSVPKYVSWIKTTMQEYEQNIISSL